LEETFFYKYKEVLSMAQQEQINENGAGDLSLNDSKKQGTR